MRTPQRGRTVAFRPRRRGTTGSRSGSSTRGCGGRRRLGVGISGGAMTGRVVGRRLLTTEGMPFRAVGAGRARMMSEDSTARAAVRDQGAETDPAGTDSTVEVRRTPTSRLPAIVIALATLAASAALGLVAHHVSTRQERVLLKERTNEVTTLLTTTLANAGTVLSGAGAA